MSISYNWMHNILDHNIIDQLTSQKTNHKKKKTEHLWPPLNGNDHLKVPAQFGLDCGAGQII